MPRQRKVAPGTRSPVILSQGRPISTPRLRPPRESSSATGLPLQEGPLRVRKLRSRLVPICSGSEPDLSSINAGLVVGRQRLRSVSSSRSPEDGACDISMMATTRVTRAASLSSLASPAPQTRSAARRGRGLSVNRGRNRTSRGRRVDNSVSQRTRSAQRSEVQPRGRRAEAQSLRVTRNKIPVQRKEQEQPGASQQQVLCCSTEGCSQDIVDHCILRLPCPMSPFCIWEGGTENVAEHLSNNHHFVTCKTGPNAVLHLHNWRRLLLAKWAVLQTCLGHNFFCLVQKVSKHGNNVFVGTVEMIGGKDAERFEFRMTLKTKGRLFSYSSIVKPYDGRIEAINKGDCFSFDTSFAENFSEAEFFTDRESLAVEISISVMKM